VTDIRSKGFKNGELDSFLAELDEETSTTEVLWDEDGVNDDALASAQRTVGFLRKEVSEIRDRLSLERGAPLETSTMLHRARIQIWVTVSVALLAARLLCGRSKRRTS
jgi:hypothetical protein